MNAIGVLEAKTKFCEICDRVATRGVSVVVTRRGRPLVRIEPVRPGRGKSRSVWDLRAAYEKQHGRLNEEFTLPCREKQTWRSPFDD